VAPSVRLSVVIVTLPHSSAAFNFLWPSERLAVCCAEDLSTVGQSPDIMNFQAGVLLTWQVTGEGVDKGRNPGVCTPSQIPS